MIILFCLCIALSGCRFKKEEKVMTREEVKQEMLDYIEQKYIEEFEIYDVEYGSWDNGGIEIMRAYPKGKESYNYFYVERKGKGYITDDYVLFTMKEPYTKKVNTIIEKYFPNAITHVGIWSSTPIPDSFRPNMDIKEFEKFANKKVSLGCSIYLIEETEADIDEEKRRSLKEELMEVNDIGSITYVGYSAEEYETYVVKNP